VKFQSEKIPVTSFQVTPYYITMRHNNDIMLPIIPRTRHCLHVQQISRSTTVLFEHEMLSNNTENLTASIYSDKSYFIDPHNGTLWQQLRHSQDWGTDDE